MIYYTARKNKCIKFKIAKIFLSTPKLKNSYKIRKLIFFDAGFGNWSINSYIIDPVGCDFKIYYLDASKKSSKMRMQNFINFSKISQLQSTVSQNFALLTPNFFMLI